MVPEEGEIDHEETVGDGDDDILNLPPRKYFPSKRAFKVVSFKAGKAVKKQKINIPARLTVHNDSLINETPGLASNSDGPSDEQNIPPSADDLDFPGGESKISKKEGL